MTHAAQLRGVTVEYSSVGDKVTALDSVTVAFSNGSATAIVGRSGSGKTTMVSVLALLRRPTRGEIILGGQDVSKIPPRKVAHLRSAAVGISFQSFHLENSLTATENVMLPLLFRSGTLSRRVARQRAQGVLEELDIGELAGRKPYEMSGGQRQRVAIARALIHRPTLLLADEPTGNLDEETANGVGRLIVSAARRFDTAVVLVTHDQAIAKLADRRMELVKGRLSERRRRSTPSRRANQSDRG